MTCSVKVFKEANCVLKRFDGAVDEHCVVSLMDKMQSHPDFDPNMIEIDDLRSVTDFQISPQDVERFHEMLSDPETKSKRPKAKLVLAGQGDAQSAALHFKALASNDADMEIEVFDSSVSLSVFLMRRFPAIHDAVASDLQTGRCFAK